MRVFRPLISSLILLCVAACGGGDGNTTYLEVRSEGQIETLEIWLKRYIDEESRATTTRLDPLIISEEQGDRPLRVRIDFPREGRYAIHFIGTPRPGALLPDGTALVETDRLIDTRCYDLTGEEIDQDVALGLLPRVFDVDGDTFPDMDPESYCAIRLEAGLPCDTSCSEPAFNALVDCNPGNQTACDDTPATAISPNEDWHPFARDACGDCLDQDCWSGDSTCSDYDGDGVPGGRDCNDDDPLIHPDAEEICGNGIDENCMIDLPGCEDGDLPCDADGDGALARMSETCGTDCDDSNSEIGPGILEGCIREEGGLEVCHGCDDELDNNCNGHVNEGCSEEDLDADGIPYRDEAGRILDCNDCNSSVGMGFATRCSNGVDEDCDGSDEPCDPDDNDGDGFRSAAGGGSDCDDSDHNSYPEAPDYCGDGIPQGCGLDSVCASITDADGDHFADGGIDCDDSNASVNPWADEICDPLGVDEDCDGQINEVLPGESSTSGCGFDPDSETWFSIDYYSNLEHCGGCRHICCPNAFQCQGDLCIHGECRCNSRPGCAGLVTDTCCPSGCADLSRDTENCGGCGASDPAFICARNEECIPNDEDYGLGRCICAATGGPCPSTPWTGCCPDGCVHLGSDARNCGECGRQCPNGQECQEGGCRCGNDGQCDDGNNCTTDRCTDGHCEHHTLDADNDNYCAAGCSDDAPLTPSGDCIDSPSDCDDSNANINPGRPEDCSTEYDDNCNEDSNDRNARNCETFYRDSDDDSYGTSESRCYCRAYDSYQARRDGDCDDSNNSANPGESEDCLTPFDDDCNGSTNERDASGCRNYNLDADGDGDGTDATQCWCSTHGNYRTTNNDDCDDSRASVHPGRSENCATPYDDNCNEVTNEQNADGCTTFYLDEDGDGYGTSTSRCYCEAYIGYTALEDGDCNNSEPAMYPGAEELCDGLNNDCDGETPDGADQCGGAEPYCCSDGLYRCCECLGDGNCDRDNNPDCVGGSCRCGPIGRRCEMDERCCPYGCDVPSCPGMM